MANFKGVAFPFKITGGGSVDTSELTHMEYRRIEDSIKQILFTYPGERVMEPEFGCRLRDFVFENVEELNTQSVIKYIIQTAIERWEPRVRVSNIIISPTEVLGEQKLFIDIYAYITQFQTPIRIQVISL